MAKPNKHRPPNAKPAPAAPSSGPTSNSSPSPSHPTSAQQQEVVFFMAEAAAISGDGTAPDPPAIEPLPTGLTIEQALKDTREARRLFEAARSRVEDERRRSDELDRAVRDQRTKQDKEESRLGERVKYADERERLLLEQKTSLTERELNASSGFLVERRRMVGELERHVVALQAELSALQTTSDASRERDSLELRARLDARAVAQRREDEVRERAIDDERRSSDDRLSKERESHRAELQVELAAERARFDAQRSRDRAEHDARIVAEDRALDARRAALEDAERALRLAKREVEAAREVVDEDAVALASKVARRAAAQVSELEGEITALRESLARTVAVRDQQLKSLASYRELEVRFGGERPEQLLERLELAERARDELETKLRASPGEAAVGRLAVLEKERSGLIEEHSVLQHQLADHQARLAKKRSASVELETLRADREAHDAQRKLLEAAIRDLQIDVDKYTQKDESRDPMEALSSIDRDANWQDPPRTVARIPSLRDFATDLRQRIATGIPERTLYYSERDVRCFLGGLAMSRMMLLQGISGTGKTSLPLAFSRAVGAEVAVIEVQAGWRDRQDLVGYFNAFDRRYYATNFLTALYRAGTPACKDRLCLIVLDEINLSRVEQFFADFLSALELPEGQRRLTLLGESLLTPPALMIEGKHLPIPPNVWFVGTANHDETTTEFADKTYDRAHVMELPRRDLSQVGFAIEKTVPREAISYEGLKQAFDSAVRARPSETRDALAWLGARDGIAGLLDRSFRVGWGNRLERDVERFVPVVVEAGGSRGEAMDHLLATKVLRKLRDRHDVRAKPLEELRDALSMDWLDPTSPPERSLHLIDRELRAKRDEAEG